MLICGIKLTQSGAVALTEDGKLIFSIELEKLNNNPRYSEIPDTKLIATILHHQGYDVSDIDMFIVDGWGGYNQDALAIQPRLEIKKKNNVLTCRNNKTEYKLNIAAYREKDIADNILTSLEFDGLLIRNKKCRYSSFLHAAGHIMGAYFTSPFAKKYESSYILAWDGGMYPRLYFYDAINQRVVNLGPLFLLIGNFYTIFAQHFGPFRVEGNFAKDDLSVAGKVMAYVALGEIRHELFEIFSDIYHNNYNKPMGFANFFANEFKKRITKNKYSDEDILLTLHKYIEKVLVGKLQQKILRFDYENRNLCIAGGCALNIKWNSAIRDSGFLSSIYIPPFPNDSGSAIGAACCAMKEHEKHNFLEWSVYGGPEIIQNNPETDWRAQRLSVTALAKLLYTKNQPVIVLQGKAELGPRALGNRSILAPAVNPKMKNILNTIKDREDYRPISPICMEEKAVNIFNPGTRDPFMLFDHNVRSGWKKKIPAILHFDGTARLQTVNKQDNRVIYELLKEYYKLSGIPILCNTSANYKGRGFFPDVKSATRWNKLNYIWCNGVLYEKKRKISMSQYEK